MGRPSRRIGRSRRLHMPRRVRTPRSSASVGPPLSRASFECDRKIEESGRKSSKSGFSATTATWDIPSGWTHGNHRRQPLGPTGPERASLCRPNARHSSRRQSARRLHPLRASLASIHRSCGGVGASFLFMKIGLEGLSFTQVVLWRLVFGALALVLVSAVSRIGLPRTFASTWLFSQRHNASCRGCCSVGRSKTCPRDSREHRQRHHTTDDYGCLPCLSAGGDADAIQIAGVASRIRWGADRIGAVESRRRRKCRLSGRLPGSDCIVRDFVCLLLHASSRRRHPHSRAITDQYRSFRDGSGLTGHREYTDAPDAW